MSSTASIIVIHYDHHLKAHTLFNGEPEQVLLVLSSLYQQGKAIHYNRFEKVAHQRLKGGNEDVPMIGREVMDSAQWHYRIDQTGTLDIQYRSDDRLSDPLTQNTLGQCVKDLPPAQQPQALSNIITELCYLEKYGIKLPRQTPIAES